MDHITLEQAKGLPQGTILHHRFCKNADGTPERWVVTSVKTWKRRPEMVEVKVKRGLYQFQALNLVDLKHYTIEES